MARWRWRVLEADARAVQLVVDLQVELRHLAGRRVRGGHEIVCLVVGNVREKDVPGTHVLVGPCERQHTRLAASVHLLFVCLIKESTGQSIP